MKKSKMCLPLIAVIPFLLLLFYQPVAENKIYHKKRDTPKITDIPQESLSNNKMIAQAKHTLENVFSIEIDDSKYDISVDYESNQISDAAAVYGTQNLAFANINFKNPKTNETIYMVGCDTSNGEILMLTQEYLSPKGDFYKPIDELKETAATFLNKMTKLTDENILYFENQIQGSTYIVNATIKNTYERYVIYLDAFDGTVFYYLKV